MLTTPLADGRCAIEPNLEPGTLIAYNTARGFNQATNKLIQQCVSHGAHSGGTTMNTGKLRNDSCLRTYCRDAMLTFSYRKDAEGENLEIKIFSFKPQVQCYGRVNRQTMVPSCNSLANEMNASSKLAPFVSRHLSTESILLPHTTLDPGTYPKTSSVMFQQELALIQMMKAGGGCRLKVSFDARIRDPLQFSSWYTIWQAVVAINSMCIRIGQRGRWLSIGYTVGEWAILLALP